MPTIEFYYDIASPYTYLAATQIDDEADKAGADVEWKPFLLGGVFKTVGNTMPAAVPPKAAFMLKDLERWSSIYEVNFAFPADNFPINSIATQRALTALYIEDPAQMKAMAMELFDRYWVRGEDVSKPETIEAAAAEVGVDAGWLKERMTDPEVKEKLRELTDEAIEKGAFGAPTFVVGDDVFFGNDRIEHVIRAVQR